MFMMVLEKADKPEIKLLTFSGSSKKQESPEKHLFLLFFDYVKDFDCVDHNTLCQILKQMGTWPSSWETCMQVRKQQVELDMEWQTGSK